MEQKHGKLVSLEDQLPRQYSSTTPASREVTLDSAVCNNYGTSKQSEGAASTDVDEEVYDYAVIGNLHMSKTENLCTAANVAYIAVST